MSSFPAEFSRVIVIGCVDAPPRQVVELREPIIHGSNCQARLQHIEHPLYSTLTERVTCDAVERVKRSSSMGLVEKNVFEQIA